MKVKGDDPLLEEWKKSGSCCRGRTNANKDDCICYRWEDKYQAFSHSWQRQRKPKNHGVLLLIRKQTTASLTALGVRLPSDVSELEQTLVRTGMPSNCVAADVSGRGLSLRIILAYRYIDSTQEQDRVLVGLMTKFARDGEQSGKIPILLGDFNQPELSSFANLFDPRHKPDHRWHCLNVKSHLSGPDLVIAHPHHDRYFVPYPSGARTRKSDETPISTDHGHAFEFRLQAPADAAVTTASTPTPPGRGSRASGSPSATSIASSSSPTNSAPSASR